MTAPVPPSPSSHALLDGKSVLVTAAAGTGIGFATAKRCAEEGAVVVLSDQHERRLGEAAEQLEEVTGARPATAVCDVTDQRQVDAMFDGRDRGDRRPRRRRQQRRSRRHGSTSST